MLHSNEQLPADLPVAFSTGPAAFTALHRGWSTLISPADRVPNVEPELFQATANGLSGQAEPVVALLGASDHPCGMIVARRSRRSLETRLGYLHLPGPRVNCLDVVYTGLRTDRKKSSNQLMQSVLAHLPELASTDVVAFNQISDSDRRRWLPTAAHGHGTPNAHWRFEFEPGDWAQTWQRFSKKHRYNLRRTRRQLHQQLGGSFSTLTDSSGLDSFRPAAESITQASWQGAIGGGFQRSPVRDAIDETAARTGTWRGFLLHVNHQPIAFHCGVRLGPVFHLQATAFDPGYSEYSPGQMLLIEAMQSLQAEGVTTIDYGFGDAPYKQRYGTWNQEERTWHLYRPAARAQLARLWMAAAETTRHHAQRSHRITGHVRRAWRRRLERGDRAA